MFRALSFGLVPAETETETKNQNESAEEQIKDQPSSEITENGLSEKAMENEKTTEHGESAGIANEKLLRPKKAEVGKFKPPVPTSTLPAVASKEISPGSAKAPRPPENDETGLSKASAELASEPGTSAPPEPEGSLSESAVEKLKLEVPPSPEASPFKALYNVFSFGSSSQKSVEKSENSNNPEGPSSSSEASAQSLSDGPGTPVLTPKGPKTPSTPKPPKEAIFESIIPVESAPLLSAGSSPSANATSVNAPPSVFVRFFLSVVTCCSRSSSSSTPKGKEEEHGPSSVETPVNSVQLATAVASN